MLRMIITHPGVTRPRSESRASWPSSLSPKRSSFYFVIFTQLYSYLVTSSALFSASASRSRVAASSDFLLSSTSCSFFSSSSAVRLGDSGLGVMAGFSAVLASSRTTLMSRVSNFSTQQNQITNLEAQTSRFDIFLGDLRSLRFLIHLWHSDEKRVRRNLD